MRFGKVIFILFFLNVSCSFFQKRDEVSEVERQENLEKKEIEAANKMLESRDGEKALLLFKKFQKDHPRSSLYLSSRLGEGESYEYLELWQEALEIYKSIADSTIKDKKEINAYSIYRQSFCYEAMGNDVKAVAILLDSLNRKKELSIEVIKAEIPARLSMFYGKQQNFEESYKFSELARRGLAELQQNKNLSQEILAKAYYQMGTVSLNQVSSNNLIEAINGQKAVQVYLIKSISMNTLPWSKLASEKLQRNYLDLWKVILELPGITGVDPESTMRLKRITQIKFGAEFLELIQEAELYFPESQEFKKENEKEIFLYLKETKKNVEKIVFQPEALLGLTSESLELNGIKRPGRIVEKNKSEKKVSDEDPNL